jgi:hypothetical protein
MDNITTYEEVASTHHINFGPKSNHMLIPKIPCGFWTKLGNFGHSWRNHFPQKFKCKKQEK